MQILKMTSKILFSRYRNVDLGSLHVRPTPLTGGEGDSQPCARCNPLPRGRGYPSPPIRGGGSSDLFVLRSTANVIASGSDMAHVLFRLALNRFHFRERMLKAIEVEVEWCAEPIVERPLPAIAQVRSKPRLAFVAPQSGRAPQG